MIPVTDGVDITRPLTLDADVVIVGSGPAGSAAAAVLAQAGARVIVVEEGAPYPDADLAPDAWTAMARAYRGMGATLARGRPPMPVVQGRCLGGGSAINGAIHWRLPRDVWDGWVAADPALGEGLPWEELEAATDTLWARLGVAPTDPAIAGRNSALMAAGAEALGIAHRPTFRNTPGCLGTGRCLQGCPTGAKQSMDRTLLADAVRHGAQVLTRVRAERVVHDHTVAVGVQARADGGGTVRLRARRAVVLAASAVQSPHLLRVSGLTRGPVGQHFQAHPGVGVLGRFPDPVRCWEGATQGHEVTGLRDRRLKFEALGLDRGVLAGRLPGLGRAWSAEVDRMDAWASWGIALKARAHGRVDGRAAPRVTYSLGDDDVRTLAEGIAWAGRMLFAAGAVEVLPGVRGFDARVEDPARLDALLTDPPRDARAYSAVCTHLFGTCRASSDPRRGVVRPDLRHHTVDRLYVMDSSVFPTNTGVNPQGSILAVATVAAARLARTSLPGSP